MILATVLLIGFAVLVITLLPRRLPLSEALVLAALHLAAWIEHTATAMDAAIVRYRMERRLLCIEMESTTTRLMEAE
jgi:hypothetical protein